MSQPYGYPYQPGKPQKLPWREGFRRYMHDPHAKGFLRFLARIAPVAFPLTVVDDVGDFIPGVDLMTIGDDLLWPFFAIAVIRMLIKVNQYRQLGPRPPLYIARPHQRDPRPAHQRPPQQHPQHHRQLPPAAPTPTRQPYFPPGAPPQRPPKAPWS